jgi:hypothetical protein
MKKIFILFFLANFLSAGDFERLMINEKIVSGKDVKKSPALAFTMSLILPGTGQIYVDRFDVGRYFIASEISLWLVYFGLNEYGRWLNDDAINFAILNAGIDPVNKNDDFFSDIENYRSVFDFNQRKGRDRSYDKIYDPEKFFWWWNSDESRQKYKDIRIKSRAMKYYAKFALVFVIVNHFTSAIDAFILAKRFKLKPELNFKPHQGLEFSLKLNF